MYPTMAASAKTNLDIMEGTGWLLGQKEDSGETIDC